MTEEWKPLNEATAALGLMAELANGLLGEYEHGFDDAFNAIIAGLEASLDAARAMPEAQHLLSGIETAVYVAKGLKEKFNNVQNTVTETNGENTNG